MDGQAMTLITNSLEPQLFETFCNCETAAKLWKKLKINTVIKRVTPNYTISSKKLQRSHKNPEIYQH
jgi:hypothetical protein